MNTGGNPRLPAFRVFLDILRRMHDGVNLDRFIVSFVKNKPLYEFIVAVMLSQNTSDRNAIKAYKRLLKAAGRITPEKILSMDTSLIAEAIRVAGMHNQRAIAIKRLAEVFAANPSVEEEIMRMGVEEARRFLMMLPGIGRKTADVVLLMYFGKPTFPIDTHIMRITLRLGAIARRDYEEARGFWMKYCEPKHYLETHLLLITHGRRICRARAPMCNVCRLARFCMFYRTSFR